MTPEEQKSAKAVLFLKKARQDLRIVEELIERGGYEVAVSRAYYAAFYAASAILLLDGLEFSKHGAVHSAIGRDYIGKEGITRQHHQNLIILFRRRCQSDYEVTDEPSEEAAKKSLKYANEWVELAGNIIKKQKNESAI